MIIDCICNKKEKTLCIGHQVCPIKARDHEMGMFGQEIWLTLESKRFVGKEGLHYKLTPREQKLRKWLIWGKWKND